MEARASGSRYALEGPEREPNYLNGTPHLTWTLRSLDGKEWLISYLACAADTLRPECMVFKSKRGRVTDWREVAVSYAEDPNEALEEVLHDMGAEDVAVAVNLSAKKEEKMADKSNCPSWAEGVPVPMDMDGNVVPLATRKLYDGTGSEVEVREIALVDSKLDRGLVWRVKTPGGVVLVLDRLRLAHSDSLEKLLEDLDRAAGMQCRASGEQRNRVPAHEVLPQLRSDGYQDGSRMVNANRMLRMLWLIIVAAWVLRNAVAFAEGRPVELEPMLLALVLMKLYEKDGE